MHYWELFLFLYPFPSFFFFFQGQLNVRTVSPRWLIVDMLSGAGKIEPKYSRLVKLRQQKFADIYIVVKYSMQIF
jgi:hypothetical protein